MMPHEEEKEEEEEQQEEEEEEEELEDLHLHCNSINQMGNEECGTAGKNTTKESTLSAMAAPFCPGVWRSDTKTRPTREDISINKKGQEDNKPAKRKKKGKNRQNICSAEKGNNSSSNIIAATNKKKKFVKPKRNHKRRMKRQDDSIGINDNEEEFPVLGSTSLVSIPAIDYLSIKQNYLDMNEKSCDIDIEERSTLAHEGWFTSTPKINDETNATEKVGKCLHVVDSSQLFACRINEKVREKYRKKWLDIAHEVSERKEIKKSSNEGNLIGVKEKPIIKMHDDSVISSWHQALQPVIVVTNAQLEHVGEVANKTTCVEMEESFFNVHEDMNSTAWWTHLFKGDDMALQHMIECGFEWTSLKLGVDGFYSLHMAVVLSQNKILELLLSSRSLSSKSHQGSDVDCLDNKKRTAFLLACELSNVECVKILLRHHAKISIADKRREGPLHKVARGGSQRFCPSSEFTRDFFVSILNLGNDDDILRCSSSFTNKNQLSILKILMQKCYSHQLKINGCNKEGDTPLLLVCSRIASSDSSHFQSLIMLLVQAGADASAVNSAGMDCLCLAARCGVPDIVDYLLYSNNNSASNRKSSTSSRRKFNPLVEAIVAEHSLCTNILIQSCYEQPVQTPILSSMIFERGEVETDKLSAMCSELCLVASVSVTPLIAAVLMNNADVIDLILKLEADGFASHGMLSGATQCSNVGFDHVVYACLFGTPKVVEIVISDMARNSTTKVQKSRATLDAAGKALSTFFGKNLEEANRGRSRSLFWFVPMLLRNGAEMFRGFLSRVVPSGKWPSLQKAESMVHHDPDQRRLYLKTFEKHDKSICSKPVMPWRHSALPFPDVLFGIDRDSTELPCHSFILMQHSSLFFKMFTAHRGMLKTTTDSGAIPCFQVSMSSHSVRSVRQLLDWMYLGTDVTASVLSLSSVPSATVCEDLHEVVDLLLLCHEFFVTRLQNHCEHFLGCFLAMGSEEHKQEDKYLDCAQQLLELGQAMNLKVLLSYVPSWLLRCPESSLQICSDKDIQENHSFFMLAISKKTLGYSSIYGKNADMPFLVAVTLRFLQSDDCGEKRLPNATVYLSELLQAVDTRMGYFSTFDVVDVLSKTFPIAVTAQEGRTDSDDDFEALNAELANFAFHKDTDRMRLFQAVLLATFSSILHLSAYALRFVHPHKDLLCEEVCASGFPVMMSNKLYWFFKRHELLISLQMDEAASIHLPDSVNTSDVFLSCGNEEPVVDSSMGAANLYDSLKGYFAHKAVLEGGSGRLRSMLRLTLQEHQHSRRLLVNCEDTEPVCLRCLLFLLYCNYLPPIKFEEGNYHMPKTFTSKRTLPGGSAPLTEDSVETFRSFVSLPFYMHLAAFADEYLVLPMMIQEAERQLTALLDHQNAGQIYLVARCSNMPTLANSAAIFYLYNYPNFMKRLADAEIDGNISPFVDIISYAQAKWDCSARQEEKAPGLVDKMDAFFVEVLEYLVYNNNTL